MSNVVKGPTHNGPAPKYTGGNHPRGKLFPGDKTGICADDALENKGHDLKGARTILPGGDAGGEVSVKGYTVLSDSPVGHQVPYSGEHAITRQRDTIGIDIDEDLDGSYTGGGDNRKAD